MKLIYNIIESQKKGSNMEFEKLSKLTIEQKKQILAGLIKDDVSYWKKVLILMAMIDENEDTELLDLVIEHKIEEINLANKKYNLFLKYSEISTTNQKSYSSVMEKIIKGSNDARYSRACKEVLDILKFIPDEYYNKINPKFIERLEKNADKVYKLAITQNTNYNDLEILNETREILLLISDKFWNTERKTIDIIEIFNK